MLVEKRIEELGLILPPPSNPVASYVSTLIVDSNVFVSGLLPVRDGALIAKGKLGGEVSLDAGVECARQCALIALANLKDALGDLDRIRHVSRLNGFVACVPSFVDHPKVVNGASDLLFSVLGIAGKHTRIAVGASSLPLDSPVMIDLIVKVKA
jgi:enamine deaminase RidA (YjgF/YER057c/UK114 family)